MADVLAGCAAWGLTAALHVALLGIFAALLDRVLVRAGDAAREVLWRVALLGGLVTASVQLAAGIDPVAGSLHALPAGTASAAGSVPAAESEAAGAADLAPALSWAWPETLAGAWLVLAVLGLVQLAWAYRGLHRQLVPRVAAPRLATQAAEIGRALGLQRLPRITWSPRAATPLALGLWRPEVCVPRRALRELSAAERDAMLAHELAHVRRRDPAWALLGAAVCRVLFWHPVPWLARRRLLQLAELRCDAVARGLGAEVGIALAGVLVRAAEWLAHAPKGVRMAHGHAMAATRSGLHQRVRLLLAPSASPVPATRLLHAGALLLCSAAPLVLPDVRPTRALAPAVPHAAAELPAPLATLLRDVATLREEVASLHDAVSHSSFAGDPVVSDLLRQIDARLQLLVERCARVVDQFLSPSVPDLR